MPFINIKGKTEWRYNGPRPNMYQVEHDELFASIRSGKPINDGVRMTHSTLAGIMGRMAAYTGQEITWDMALNSTGEPCAGSNRLGRAAPVAAHGHAGQDEIHLIGDMNI